MATRCPKCDFDNTPDSKFCKECGTQLPPPAKIVFTETLETAKEELTTGSTFAGRYQIIEELGSGGMGKVYRALDKKLNEEVALKLIKPEIGLDKKAIERFSNELKLSRKIVHKNVAQMYDLNEHGGAHYITMEYVRGEDLRRLIRKMGILSPAQAVPIVRQICEGLAEAHELGIVHRDLKPGNIMIDEEGKARIMDFGIARSLTGKGITGAGVMIGTPEYMSPEQAEGGEIDRRSDIYSLGIILYEMLAGRVPFSGDTPLSVAVKQKTESPPDPRRLNPQIPADLSRLILRCLEKDKSKRYQNSEELRSDLEKAEKGIPATERIAAAKKPLTSREITVKFDLKNLLVPALIILLALAAALFYFKRSRGPRLDPGRIVVAVFENQTGNTSLDPVGRMAADWITQGLQQTGLVSVVPSPPGDLTSSPKGKKTRLRDIAEETGAGTVVSGVYYLQGNTLRFQARVTDERKGKLLASLDPVTGLADDPTAPVETLRQKVMGALASVFDPSLKAVMGSGSQPPTYEAYLQYLEGFQLFMSREFKKAIGPLTSAAALDSAFYMPRLLIAAAHSNLGEYREAEAAVREVEKYREKLSPFDRSWLDWFEAWLRRDYQASYRAGVRMAELSPSDLMFYQNGLDAMSINRPREAIAALRKADPQRDFMKTWSPYWSVMTNSYHMLGDYKQELKEARWGRRLHPELLSTLWYEVRALAALGRITEVERRIEESLTLPPQTGWSPGDIMSSAGNQLRLEGYKKESLRVLDRAIQWYKGRPPEEVKSEALRSSLGEALYAAERWAEAGAVFEELWKETPESVEYLGHIGTVAARTGERVKATEVSEKLAGLKTPYLFGENTYWRACIASILGDRENAVSLLRDALAQGVSYPRLYDDMDLENMLEYPPFQELIKPKG